MIDEVKALRVEIAALTAERDQLRRSVGDLCRKYDKDLAAANARADAAEANRDHWRGACVKAMVTGEYPVSPHDDDPQIKSLREAAEASFHGQAYTEMAKRARKAEEALAAARRETAETLERAAQALDSHRYINASKIVRALASPAAAPAAEMHPIGWCAACSTPPSEPAAPAPDLISDGCFHGDKAHPCALPRVQELESALRLIRTVAEGCDDTTLIQPGWIAKVINEVLKEEV